MKKPLIIAIIVLLALLVVGYVVAQFFLGSIVKTGVNQIGPRVTQTKVELADASISPLSGQGTLNGFVIGNPKGWSEGNLLQVGHVHFDVDPGSVLGDTIVINELVIEAPEFVYETRVVSSNIGDLLKNIEKAMGPGSESPDSKEKPRKFIVKHFRMEQAKVSIGVGAAALPLQVPPIEFKDLGVKEGGLTSSQLALAVFGQVLPHIVAATTDAAAKVGGTMGAAASESLKKAGENLQKFLGGSKK